MMPKKSFSIHSDYYNELCNLTSEQRGDILLALVNSAMDIELPELDPVCAMLFRLMKAQSERISSANSANGAKGGRKKASEESEFSGESEKSERKQIKPSVSVTITKDTKDYPTGELEKPSASPAPPDGELTDTAEPLLPVSEAPDAMRQTAEYLLFKTGRTGLTEEEISALRTLNASQYPARVQKEIDIAVDRFKRLNRPPDSLTFCYIADSLARQPSRPSARDAPRQRAAPDYSELNV